MHMQSATFCNLGNPFCDFTNDLLTLDTKEVMGEDAVVAVQTVEGVGQSQYDTFVSEPS